MTTHRKFVGLALALAAGAATLAPATAAFAQYDTRYDSDQAYAQAQAARQDQARRDYDAQYGPGAYDRYYAAQADGAYRQDRDGYREDRDAYREDRRECHEEKKGNEVGGALLGGIAGAVIGSNVARGGGREGGAIIGGVGGAALGSSIAKNSTHC